MTDQCKTDRRGKMWKLTGQTMMSPDMHTLFAVMHLPLASIGKAYILSFDKLV